MGQWMTKQAIRCLRWGNDDRASWYEQRTWESHIKRRFYDIQIDRASKELSGLMGGCRNISFIGHYDFSLSGYVYIHLGKCVALEPNRSLPVCTIPLMPCSFSLEIAFCS